ncbi:hypothetical protein [Gracilibacillus sp. YIM 98692]|uniref:hypothetical protein n=1 Tax=Gracilibacillus sp. YIM 98692 TaxID=2663532 RepID=UPI0013D1D5B7|nr:hypothetical protein [Gracilibacillus sp. YIM 98692]
MTKKEWMYVSIIGALIMTNLVMYSKLANVERTLENMQFEVQNTNHSVQNISTQVHQQMNEMLQEQLWIPKKDYQVMDANIEENTITVNFEWTLRELNEDAVVSLLYREEGEENWQEIQMENERDLNYHLSQTFSLDKNYQTQILASSENHKRSEDLFSLDFKKQMEHHMMIDAFLNVRNEDVVLNVHIHNPTDHKFLNVEREKLSIQKASAFLYHEDDMIREIDLMENNQHAKPDPNAENITYHESITIDEKYSMRELEVRVLVEDGLGMEHEKITDTFH